MLTTLLIVALSVIALSALAVIGLVVVMRSPRLAARLMRFAFARKVMARVARAGLESARKKAAASGATKGAGPISDLEVVLADQSGPEAERAKALLAGMNPRQRQELSRMAMGADGLEGLMAAGADGGEAAMEMLGRSERRRAAGAATSSAPRAAQKSKAVAKRRKARKANRSR